MPIRTTLCLALATQLLGPACAPAGEPSPSALLAMRQLPIARRTCWLKAQPEFDSGVTQRVIQANAAYAACLEGLAVTTLTRFYPPESLAGEDPRRFLDRLLSDIDTLSWTIETQPASCAPACGTMWQMSASGAKAEFLETMLQRMAERLLLEHGDTGLSEDPRWQTCWKQPEQCDTAWLNKQP